ncbi:MAG: hypothetical protein BVN31_06645 [Proteobacteria bacterium ST_bin15]|nr:MAG: hypothetical protein BVN31_06645 [Proteobacteria bacterium ST_bin15]
MVVSQAIVSFLYAYGVAGLVSALLFLLLGIDRVEPSARGAYAFRPLIVPGLVMLWPLVLWRWWQIVQGRGADVSVRRPFLARHVAAWNTLAVVLPIILFAALALRQSGPFERPAVPIDQRAISVESGR